jgi:acetylglutamate kinase
VTEKAGIVKQVETAIARQRHGKHVSTATYSDATIDELMCIYAAMARQRRDKHLSSESNQHETIQELFENGFSM